MQHLGLFCAMVAVNTILVGLWPGTAMTASDPVILVFGVYGVSHMETMMLVATWRLHQWTERLRDR